TGPPIPQAQRVQPVLDAVAQLEQREIRGANRVRGEHHHVVAARECPGLLPAEDPEHGPVGPRIPLGDDEDAHQVTPAPRWWRPHTGGRLGDALGQTWAPRDVSSTFGGSPASFAPRMS